MTPAETQVVPNAGGPPDQWQVHNVMKFCYQRGVAQMECSKQFNGNLYTNNCGPLSQYTQTNASGLWAFVSEIFAHHAPRECLTVGAGGGLTGVIVTMAASGAVIGIVAGLAGGCVLNFYWN